jgi:hypothetical protein
MTQETSHPLPRNIADIEYNCEVVAVFNSIKSLETAADELFTHGIDHSQLSVLAKEQDVIQQLGKDNYTVNEISDLSNVPKVSYNAEENIGAAQGVVISGLIYVVSLTAIGFIIAGDGSVTRIIATALAAGTVAAWIGVYLASLIGQNHADYLNTQLKKGGILLWVHIQNPNKSKIICDILKKNDAYNVHVHCVTK